MSNKDDIRVRLENDLKRMIDCRNDLVQLLRLYTEALPDVHVDSLRALVCALNHDVGDRVCNEVRNAES